MFSARLLAAIVVVAALARVSAMSAQTGTTGPPGQIAAAARAPIVAASCAGQRIDSVVVIVGELAMTGGRFEALDRLASAYHVHTRDKVIRRFLLLKEGDRCEELRRAESERVLRVQPYLAEVSVQTAQSATGTVFILVNVVDEAALIAGGTVRADRSPIRALKLGNSNIGGYGIYADARWSDGGQGYRDGFGARFTHHQLFGRPYLLDFRGERYSLGEEWGIAAAHPFFTDLQRIAWRARLGAGIEYVAFPATEGVDRAVRLDRRYYDIGGILRIGPPGRLSLFGASVSSDDEQVIGEPVLMTDTGVVPDTGSALIGRFGAYRMARINMLWGVRDIAYVRVRGFDALNGTQDLPIGFQAGALFGRSLSVLGATVDDIFVSGDVYAAVGGRERVTRLQLHAEGRRANDTERWDGLLTSGRASLQWRWGIAQTFQTTVEWSGGWRQRTPFNLRIADREGGVRGHASSREVGARRLVGRVENRWSLNRVGNVATGLAIFADAGRLWAGDVPYGTTTPVRSAVGVSLLGATPPQSRRLWRLDLTMGFPPSPGSRRFDLRLSSADYTRQFFREPRDVERARERTVPSSIFRWP